MILKVEHLREILRFQREASPAFDTPKLPLGDACRPPLTTGLTIRFITLKSRTGSARIQFAAENSSTPSPSSTVAILALVHSTRGKPLTGAAIHLHRSIAVISCDAPYRHGDVMRARLRRLDWRQIGLISGIFGLALIAIPVTELCRVPLARLSFRATSR